MTASGDTTIGEADAALRSESALLDERLPVRWDGEIIHWTDRWTDIGDMLFLCGNNRLRTLQACPGTDSRRRWNQHRPHLWKPWHHRPHDPKPVMPDALRRVRTDPRGRAPV